MKLLYLCQQTSYSLPPFMQWLVAIAAIISSGAVFVYIKQLKILRQQVDLTSSQFMVLNQGYITANFDVAMLNAPGEYFDSTKELPFDYAWYGFAVYMQVTNPGNLPVKFTVNPVEVSFTQTGGILSSNPLKGEKILFPHDNMSAYAAETHFSDGRLTKLQIHEQQIEFSVRIDYYDVDNRSKTKKLDRRLRLRVDGSRLSAVYVSIDDSVS